MREKIDPQIIAKDELRKHVKGVVEGERNIEKAQDDIKASLSPAPSLVMVRECGNTIFVVIEPSYKARIISFTFKR